MGMAYFGRGKSNDARFFHVKKERDQFCFSHGRCHKLENGAQRVRCAIEIDSFAVAGKPAQEKHPMLCSWFCALKDTRRQGGYSILYPKHNIVS